MIATAGKDEAPDAGRHPGCGRARRVARSWAARQWDRTAECNVVGGARRPSGFETAAGGVLTCCCFVRSGDGVALPLARFRCRMHQFLVQFIGRTFSHSLRGKKTAAGQVYKIRLDSLYIKQTQNDNLTIVNSPIIENSKPIENGDFGRFLASSLARFSIFL